MTELQSLPSVYPKFREMGDWATDHASGSLVRKFTNPPAWCHNYYCEQPYGSPDGKRFLIVRAMDVFSPTRQLLIANLEDWTMSLIENEVYETPAHSPWSEWLYYQVTDGSIRRVSLLTLERQHVLPPGIIGRHPVATLASISPDDKTLMIDEAQSGGGFRTSLIEIDSGKITTIAQGPYNRNSHAQFDRREADPHTLIQYFEPQQRSQIQLITRSQKSGRQSVLPIGGDWCAESTGHMAWIGTTGKVACALEWDTANRRHDPRHPQGNIAVAGPDDARPTIVHCPEYALYHISVSRCGTYWIGDDFMNFRADSFSGRMPGPSAIVIGNFKSGKYRALVADCQNFGISGSSRYEPTPYLTADNRYAIYNASPFGVMQVFAAHVPDAFLKSLD